MTRSRLFAAFVAVALAAAAIFVPVPWSTEPALPPLPDGPQTLQNHELAPQLRRRVQQALEEQGQNISSATLVTVGPEVCPAVCNAGMERGLCYCQRDASQVCPAGWPLTRGDPRSSCASLPQQVLVQPEGDGTEAHTIQF